jgi:hypothetical protein
MYAVVEKVFRETASGAKIDLVQLRRALDQLAKGDVLTVTRIERWCCPNPAASAVTDGSFPLLLAERNDVCRSILPTGLGGRSKGPRWLCFPFLPPDPYPPTEKAQQE